MTQMSEGALLNLARNEVLVSRRVTTCQKAQISNMAHNVLLSPP
jgi:hypothetical protein